MNRKVPFLQQTNQPFTNQCMSRASIKGTKISLLNNTVN